MKDKKEVFEKAQNYETAWWVRHITHELAPPSRDWLVGYQDHVGRGHMARMGLNRANQFWSMKPPAISGNILDLGSGIVSFFEGKTMEVWAVEPSLNNLKIHFPQLVHIGEIRNVTYFPGEIYEIADNRFDNVWCCNMLDHTPDWHFILHNEIPRVLRPGGRLYLSVDCRRSDVKLDAGHLTKFMPDMLNAHLRDAGFAYIWDTPKIPDAEYFRYDWIGELRA